MRDARFHCRLNSTAQTYWCFTLAFQYLFGTRIPAAAYFFAMREAKNEKDRRDRNRKKKSRGRSSSKNIWAEMMQQMKDWVKRARREGQL